MCSKKKKEEKSETKQNKVNTPFRKRISYLLGQDISEASNSFQTSISGAHSALVMCLLKYLQEGFAGSPHTQ